jgi:predicted methyltransferase
VTTGDLDAALAGTWRDADRARDAARHPGETLRFFGIEPTMTVVECWPGGGWYTRILAPLLRDHGRLISGGIPLGDERRGQYEQNFRTMVAAHPELYDQIQLATLHPGDFLDDVPSESVDAVLTFRSVHNWIRSEGHNPSDYFAAVARVLRPGGVLGVVQHRAPDDHPAARDGTTGYVSEARVLELAQAAGLVLEARSELNANPRDDHDHPEGVWSLPPASRGEGMTPEEREAIGESDRMTLRFRKPRAR